jgi:hypothetical protein
MSAAVLFGFALGLLLCRGPWLLVAVVDAVGVRVRRLLRASR